MAVLTPDEVIEYLQDKVENNHLLSGPEFSATQISLAIDLAVSEWNVMPPLGVDTVDTFPFAAKSILMAGVCWKLFEGASALLARNTMQYSDGGLTVPIEERAPLYMSLAAMFQASFQSSARALKTHLNLESGWGQVLSDESSFPGW